MRRAFFAKSRILLSIFAGVPLLHGCTPAERAGSAGATAADDDTSTISPNGIVPPFRLSTLDGSVIDSKDLVGHKPFVVVFFASWCQICDAKMPVVVRTLDAIGGGGGAGAVPVIAIATDEDETWSDVAPWILRHQMRYPVVRGSSTTFTRRYNPFGGVPLVLVVGPEGRLLEVQLGYAADDAQRLREALDLAKAAMARRGSGGG